MYGVGELCSSLSWVMGRGTSTQCCNMSSRVYEVASVWFRQNTWKGWLQQIRPSPFISSFSMLSPRGARRFCPVASRNVQSLFCSDQPALSGTENLAEWYAIESVTAT